MISETDRYSLFMTAKATTDTVAYSLLYRALWHDKVVMNESTVLSIYEAFSLWW